MTPHAAGGPPVRQAILLIPGALLGAAMYFALLAVAPPSSAPMDDAWAAHFRDRGFNARLRSVSTQPQRHFAVVEWRADARLQGATLTDLMVEDLRVQIARFPSDAPAIALLGTAAGEGRHAAYSWCRRGRYLLIVPPVRMFLAPRAAPSEGLVRRIAGAFAAQAERLP